MMLDTFLPQPKSMTSDECRRILNSLKYNRPDRDQLTWILLALVDCHTAIDIAAHGLYYLTECVECYNDRPIDYGYIENELIPVLSRFLAILPASLKNKLVDQI